ncbi:MAG: hypothetical protein IPP66_22575 [Anaerolineales bacterium]|nr:hypothetical protein [Anaerolineales bacterium]
MSLTINSMKNYWSEKKSKQFLVFLSFISLVGMSMAIYITYPYGAGVSGDAARNLSVAHSLLKGNGFFDLFGKPLVYWPPLYSILLAGLGVITHEDVFIGGWYLNVALYGLNIFFSGVLLYRIFRTRLLYAVIGSLLTLLSISSFRIHVNIASDPLYIAFSLLFLIATCQYADTRSSNSLLAMVIFSALATLQRYVGITLIVVGVSLIARQNWGNWRKTFLDSLKFSILSSLPIAAWIFWHNYLKYGAIAGNPYNTFLPSENVRASLIKIIRWFIPFQLLPDFLVTYPWVLLIGLVLVLLLINKIKDWKTWWDAIYSPYILPIIMYFIVSFIGLTYTVATFDHKDIESDRYYITILLPVLIMIFITWEQLIFPHIKLKPQVVDKILFVLFMIWSIYPLHGFQEFISESRQINGVTSYNTINSHDLRNSETLKQLNSLLSKDDTVALYSNDPLSVWFYTHHDAFLLPKLHKETTPNDAEAKKLASWPPQAGYVIWIKPDTFKETSTPDELSQIAKLELLYTNPDGEIYFIRANNGEGMP